MPAFVMIAPRYSIEASASRNTSFWPWPPEVEVGLLYCACNACVALPAASLLYLEQPGCSTACQYYQHSTASSKLIVPGAVGVGRRAALPRVCVRAGSSVSHWDTYALVPSPILLRVHARGVRIG